MYWNKATYYDQGQDNAKQIIVEKYTKKAFPYFIPVLEKILLPKLVPNIIQVYAPVVIDY